MTSRPSPLEITVREIAPTETRRLRQTILWPSIAFDDQLLPYDTEPTTVHLGAFLTPSSDDDDDEEEAHNVEKPAAEPVGCLTLVVEPYAKPESLPAWATERVLQRQIQLHKFAVFKEMQGRSVGRQLLQSALERLANDGTAAPTLFHFDARANQRGFYQRLGMVILDEQIFVKRGSTGLGPPVEHIRMGTLIG